MVESTSLQVQKQVLSDQEYAVLELRIARALLKQGNKEEALEWYTRATQTLAKYPELPVSVAVVALFLRVTNYAIISSIDASHCSHSQGSLSRENRPDP